MCFYFNFQNWWDRSDVNMPARLPKQVIKGHMTHWCRWQQAARTRLALHGTFVQQIQAAPVELTATRSSDPQGEQHRALLSRVVSHALFLAVIDRASQGGWGWVGSDMLEAVICDVSFYVVKETFGIWYWWEHTLATLALLYVGDNDHDVCGDKPHFFLHRVASLSCLRIHWSWVWIQIFP